MRIYPNQTWGAPLGCHTAIIQLTLEFGGTYIYTKKHFEPIFGAPHTSELDQIIPQTPDWDRLQDHLP